METLRSLLLVGLCPVSAITQEPNVNPIAFLERLKEDTQYTCEPLGDLRYLFRTTNECHSNEHPQNLVSGDKISQDSSKEPIQLDRDCTPKQTGDRSSDP